MSVYKVDANTGKCGIILDKTTFYHEAGGQVSDAGEICVGEDVVFKVEDVQRLPSGHVLHVGRVEAGSGCLPVGAVAKTRIDTGRRISLMQNHTAVHPLNSVLHETLPLTCQRSSLVTPQGFKHEFSVYSVNLDTTFVDEVESKVNELLGHPDPLGLSVVQGLADHQGDLITIPGAYILNI